MRRFPLSRLSAILAMFVAQGAQSLPFTLGSPAPVDMQRYSLGGEEHRLFTFDRDGEVRPSILYGDSASFIADRIVFDDHSEQITAIGDVRVTLGSDLLLGDHLEYNLQSKRGMLTNANLRSEYLRVTGGKIEIREVPIVDRTETRESYSYEILDGSITASQYTIPHYYLAADFMRLVPEVRAWLYSASYRLLGVPIFYLPYLTRSLRKEPFAYVFEPGYDSEKGFILLNRFHFHYQDIYEKWMRATLYADLFSDQGVGIGGKWTYYREEGSPDSYLHAYYIDQKNDFGEEPDARVNTEGSRGKFYYQHFQKLNPSWTLTGKGRRLSDPDFDEDYRDEELIRGFDSDDLQSDRDAFINLARRRPNSNFRLIAKERLDDFNLLEYPEDERQEVVYDSKERPFKGTQVFHRTRFSAGHYKSHQTTATANVDRVVTADGQDADIEEEFFRADLDFELSRPYNFKQVSAIPFLGYEGTLYSEGTRKTRVWSHRGENQTDFLYEEYDGLARHVGTAGIEFITRRSLDLSDPSRDIERRLLIEPSVTLLAQIPNEDLEDLHPDRTQSGGGGQVRPSTDYPKGERPGFPDIDEVDSIRSDFVGLEFRLESRLQTRRRGGATRDAMRAAVSTAYDFTEDGRNEEELATVFAELYVAPFEWLSFSNFLEYEPDGSFVRSARSSVLFDPKLPFSLELAYSTYQDDEAIDAEEEVSWILGLPLSERYSFTYEERYDMDDSEVRLRRLGIVRDFPDWVLTVGVRQSKRESRDKSFGTYFTLRLKTPRGLEGKTPFDSKVTGNREDGVLPPS